MLLAVAFEGDDDLPVVRKLASDAGFVVGTTIDCGGKGNIDLRINGYNSQAQGTPWLVLRDLDNDAECASLFLSTHRRYRRLAMSEFMCLRVAVREMEAWLLADHEGFAAFFKVEPRWLPSTPDAEADPTRTLVDIVKRYSRHGQRRRAIVPTAGSVVAYGPGYDAAVIEFAALSWSLDRAARRSPSLRRARSALRDLGARWARVLAGTTPNS